MPLYTDNNLSPAFFKDNEELPVLVTIRSAKTEDLAAIAALDRLCLGGLWSLQTYQRELDSPNSTLLIATLDDRNPPQKAIALGCFWAILEEAHITLLAVHPQYRRSGIGQLLLAILLQRAAAIGLERATLEVRASNTIALALYDKFGFRQAGRRRKYYHKPEEDALILWQSGLEKAEFQLQIEKIVKECRDRLLTAGWLVQETV